MNLEAATVDIYIFKLKTNEQRQNTEDMVTTIEDMVTTIANVVATIVNVFTSIAIPVITHCSETLHTILPRYRYISTISLRDPELSTVG